MFQYYFLILYFNVSSQAEELQLKKHTNLFKYNQKKQAPSTAIDEKNLPIKKRKISTNTEKLSKISAAIHSCPQLVLPLESNDDFNPTYKHACKDEKIQSNETKKNKNKGECQAIFLDKKLSKEILIEKINDWQKEDKEIKGDSLNLSKYKDSEEIRIYDKNRTSVSNKFYSFKNFLKENLDKIEEVVYDFSIDENQKKILSDQFLFLIIGIEYIIDILPKGEKYSTRSYFLIFRFNKIYKRLYILYNTFNLIQNFEILVYNLKTFSINKLKADKLSAINHVEEKLNYLFKNLENIRECCDAIVLNLTILREKYKKQFKIIKK
ncbi:uncharacterized protein VNE69_06201 [Vairimorpha necatrix]|uniref:Uncharacterized protein n=1 Tax=Vairimorpha necatrix TaxID=6039 RepID=A0AAX4JD20_9MICR